MLPFSGRNRVTQIFSSKHGGIDVVGDDTHEVRAVKSGIVEMIQQWDGKTRTGSQSYGNLVRILSSDGIYTYYAHLSKICVRKNQTVSCGDIIGIMGNTGNSFGAHLHLEARKGKTTSCRIDPSQVCELKNVRTTFKSDAEVAYDYNIKIKRGAEIFLDNTDLYISSTADKASCKKSGKFYIYNTKIINNRIRITCSAEYVGKTPIGKYVTGWVSIKDIKA